MTTIVAAEIERAVGTKWAGHQINQVHFIRPEAHDEPDRRLSVLPPAWPSRPWSLGRTRYRRQSRTLRRPPSSVGATASQPAERLTPPGPHIGGCPVFPADNAWNQEIASAPLHPRQRADHRHIQAIGGAQPPPRLRREPATTASRSSSSRRPAARADHLRRLRRRERSRAVPDPARRAGRRRRRVAATATCSCCSSRRASCSSCSSDAAPAPAGSPTPAPSSTC